MKVTDQLAELRGLPVEDLRQRARDVEDQVFRLRLQQAMGQQESGHRVRPLRRERARIMTVLREKGVMD